MILAVVIFCIIVIELSRMLHFPHTVTLVMFLYFAQLRPRLGLPDSSQNWGCLIAHRNELLPSICSTTCFPLSGHLTCCPGPWGHQVLSVCAPRVTRERDTGDRQHILAMISENTTKTTNILLTLEKGKI